jgi:hypothetical protein
MLSRSRPTRSHSILFSLFLSLACRPNSTCSPTLARLLHFHGVVVHSWELEHFSVPILCPARRVLAREVHTRRTSALSFSSALPRILIVYRAYFGFLRRVRRLTADRRYIRQYQHLFVIFHRCAAASSHSGQCSRSSIVLILWKPDGTCSLAIGMSLPLRRTVAVLGGSTPVYFFVVLMNAMSPMCHLV